MMSSRAPAKQDKSATKPRQKMQGHTHYISGIIRHPDKRQIITGSGDGSLRVWDLESGMQVGDAWKDEGSEGVLAIALSPDGKTVASGSIDGTVRLWNIDTGKVIQKWTGHTDRVRSICWSPDGERVVSGSADGTFRVWDVESGKIIIGPIKAGDSWVYAVCYSPDGTMIATGADQLKVWDANTGGLLKTLEEFIVCLAWTLDGKTLIAGSGPMKKFDTATWTETATVLDGHGESIINGISLSPNERILASASLDKTARLWDLQTNQPIGPPLHHEDKVNSAAFSADGKFLTTACDDNHVYTWYVSAILREAGLHDLLSEKNTVKKSGLHADATRRHRPAQIDGARRLPPGFFDDFSPSHGQRDHRTTAPHQRTLLGRLPSFWPRRRRSNPHGETERDTQSPSHPRSLANILVSGILRRQDRSEIQLREPPVVDVPCTWAKPRNYHARGKKAARSSKPLNSHTMQQSSGATQSQPTSSQLQPTAIITSTTLPPVAGTAGATGTMSCPDITVRQAGWWIRFLLWIGCASVEYMDNQP